MKQFLLLPFFVPFTFHSSHAENFPQSDINPNPGQVSAIQTATSETETSINILRPIRHSYTYKVTGPRGTTLKKLGTTSSGKHYWVVDRLHISGLQKTKTYELLVQSKYGKVVDRRTFRSLPLKRKKLRFAMGSCASDAFIHAHVRDLIWDKMLRMKPDMVLLTGDIVYVDAKDYVSRKKVTPFDIWQRYIESVRSLKIFRHRQLTPILAIWDDHDFGLNNADQSFPHKSTSEKVFKAFFGGENIDDVFQSSDTGVYKSFQGFNQRFFLLDNRFFRAPSGSKKPYAQWGPTQHEWLLTGLKSSNTPAWIINGGQFFTKPVLIEGKRGPRQINESLLADHPTHFKIFMDDLKTVSAPVVFGSGDIHFSEILKIDNELDYETFELTASPLHAYIFRTRPGQSEFWTNPRRIIAHKDYGFFLIESRIEDNAFHIKVEAHGVKQNEPYFSRTLKVSR